MIYHIRVVGPERGLGGIGDFADIVAAPTHDGAILSCEVPDASGLTGVVALLCDLGVDIAELRAVGAHAGDAARAD
ncbi:hypothetical protein [Cellulomonas pakistanensis]|uniref:Uncharacterized protein n=1 Tax=Cellulomonas pakistanensis TaxID=992287 RepID=A0A919PC84_9CELL|nr:hypothetical protein [Cellulomonas pakistanensis]GIG37836.1 hypothetical protein Cpa01nite_32170 [Cellulomonas pakistanensis]